MADPESGRILDYWEAFDRVNALPDSWQQTATICQMLSQLLSFQAASTGTEIPPDDWTAFMPPRWVRPIRQPKIKVQSDEELSRNLDRALGK